MESHLELVNLQAELQAQISVSNEIDPQIMVDYKNRLEEVFEF